MGQIIRALRSGDWATPERITAWLVLLSIGNITGVGIVVCHLHGWLLAYYPHLSTEFMGFYAAGRLADLGQAALAYAPAGPAPGYIASFQVAPAHAAMQQAVSGDPKIHLFTYFYPPVAWLAFAPLAHLPFYGALLVWDTLTALFYLFALRGICGGWRYLWTVLADLAIYENAGVGENAFLLAGCLGFGLLWLEDRPMRAGLVFGLLCFKPPLLLPIGLLLLFGRRWRALAAMAAAGACLCLLAGSLFGWVCWRDYFGIVVPHAEWMLRHAGFSHAIQMTPFAAIRLLGGGIGLADLVAAATTLFGIACLFGAVRRASLNIQAAILAASLPLVMHVMFDYDLTICGLAIAFLVREANATSFRPWEKTALAAMVTLPLLAWLLRTRLGLPLDPLVEVAILLVLLGRVWRPLNAAGLAAYDG
jgi:hypothetical protein